MTQNGLRLVVLESPFAGDIEGNIAYGKRALLDCLYRGEAPIASHLLWTQPGILDDNKPEERRMGIAAGHAWVPVADASVVYIDRGISRGVEAGINAAREHKVPVEYRQLERSKVEHELRDFLAEKLPHSNIDEFLSMPNSAFGDMSPQQFVGHLMYIGNAKDTTEGWLEVYATYRRVFA